VSEHRRLFRKNELTVNRLPLYQDGRLIGGVGVSGGTVAQDVDVATAGVAGIGANFTAGL